MLAAPVAIGQDATESAAEAEKSSDERVLDTISVTAVQDDAAMAAFQAGDFETAEVEFLDNAMCAQLPHCRDQILVFGHFRLIS